MRSIVTCCLPGVYTNILLQHLTKPGMEILQVFRTIGEKLSESGKQTQVGAYLRKIRSFLPVASTHQYTVMSPAPIRFILHA